MQNSPKLSIISPSKNTGKFLRDTIESILSQTYKDWEHIVVDGGSTDETLDILKEYPHIRWISEPDSGPDEAYLKGLAMAKGRYVMMCCISDGYLDKNWFRKCVEILDNDQEISLVWGIDQNMLEDGSLQRIVNSAWFDDPPPSGTGYIYYWLTNRTLFLERTLCCRTDIMKECFPPFDPGYKGQGQGHLTFAYNFNRLGYLPRFVPNVVAFARQHGNAASQVQLKSGETKNCEKKYFRQHGQFRRKVMKGEAEYFYRDGNGRRLPYKFSVKEFLKSDTGYRLKNIESWIAPPALVWLQGKLFSKYRKIMGLKETAVSGKINSEDKK